ncbi:lipoyl synthase [Alienimonas chondri]|uniref:Lipoyl synthase n=1 Tax=Alienimonas chondri TaxID=2681879 RepID=A0ABX1VJ07_9PLAN|nr:Lipoyl synthase [Alienimonas chondri]
MSLLEVIDAPGPCAAKPQASRGSVLNILEAPERPLAVSRETDRKRRLPKWLRRPLPAAGMAFTDEVIRDLDLVTVCESAKCPNRTECWSHKTATLMIAGNVCTRPCGFCSVPKGKTEQLQLDEPDRVAEAAKRLGLEHVVLTSVTRDDLPDGGAAHWAACVRAVKEACDDHVTVEVLTPDFRGNVRAIDVVIDSGPDVFNHNTETVPRLYHRVRRNADYQRTLDLLARVKERAPGMPTKSGVMLGLGETREELLDVCADLRSVGCEMLTLGQYLQPTGEHLPVERYVPPEEFDEVGDLVRELGFGLVASGPFVRSSYHAGEMKDVLNANRSSLG